MKNLLLENVEYIQKITNGIKVKFPKIIRY